MALGTDHCTSVHLASLYMLTWYFEGAVLGTTSSACTSARDTANYWRNTANLQPENCAREPLKPPNVHSRFPVATSKSRVDNPTPSLVVASMWSPLGENEIAGLPFSLLQRAMYAAIQSLRNICSKLLKLLPQNTWKPTSVCHDFHLSQGGYVSMSCVCIIHTSYIIYIYIYIYIYILLYILYFNIMIIH